MAFYQPFRNSLAMALGPQVLNIDTIADVIETEIDRRIGTTPPPAPTNHVFTRQGDRVLTRSGSFLTFR